MTKPAKPLAVQGAWLDPYREQFLKTLGDQGYAAPTLRTYDGAAKLLCRAVSQSGLHKGQLAGRTLSKVHAAALAAMPHN